MIIFFACGWSPPSGRPPIGPLERFEPKLYDLNFAVNISTLHQPNVLDRQSYNLINAPIVFPIIFLSTYHKVESDSVEAKLWLDSREEDPHFELKAGYPHSTHLATLTVVKYNGFSLRWQVGYRAQSWSSRIDDEKAAAIPWPREWPKEVQDGLQPQMYIESGDPIFADEVRKISQDQLRMVPPYLAAKDIIRHCLNEIQISGSMVIRDEFKVIRGMNVRGAKEAAARKIGSPHDLVCICVAMLRAAGIPARPVVGVHENEKDQGEFVSWAEFYLPDAGWISFDPYVMRGKGIRSLDVRQTWPEFGTMKDLNKRIPLAYHFLPPATIQSPRNPAVWGWDPRPGKDAGSDQQVYITIISRGKGVEDPK